MEWDGERGGGGADKLVLPAGDLHEAVKAGVKGEEAELMLKGQCVRTEG